MKEIHGKKYPEKNRTSSFKELFHKIDIENLSFLGLIFLCIYFCLIIPSILEISDFYKQIKVYSNLYFYLLLIPGFMISRGLHKFSINIGAELLRPYVLNDSSKPGENDKDKFLRIGNTIYGSIYYFCSFFSLFLLSWTFNMLPIELGGTLNMKMGCSSWPYIIPVAIQIYYMLTLGHHIERTYNEFLYNKKSTTFYTMLFHHFLTILLIALSFFNMHIKFGIPVLLTHDFCDIALNLGRVCKYTKYKHMSTFFYVILLISWTYGRLYIFTTNIINGMLHCLYVPQEWMTKFFFLHVIYIPAVFSLFCLNVYWLIQILNIGYLQLFKKDFNIAYLETKKEDSNDK